MAKPIDELNLSWSTMQPAWVFATWKRDNPGEWSKLDAFFKGTGPDPGDAAIKSDHGKHLLHEARAKMLLNTPVPPPKPPPPPPPSSQGIPLFGVCPGNNSSQWSNAQHAQAMTLMQTMFHGHPWAWRVNTQGPNAIMDRDVYNVQAAGGTPYMILYSSQGPRSIDTLPTVLAQRYNNTTPLPIFTGPNEPDLDRNTKVHWTPAPLADFQLQLYDQVKAVNPNYKVGSPAYWKTWISESEPSPYTQSRAKLREFITEQCTRTSTVTGKAPIDFWAFHGYDDPTIHAVWNVWDWWFPGGTVPASETMSQTAVGLGVNLPYVMDEGGANVANGEATQGSRDLKLFQEVGNRANCCYVYSLYDNGDGFQIVNSDGSARIAYTNLSNFMAALP